MDNKYNLASSRCMGKCVDIREYCQKVANMGVTLLSLCFKCLNDLFLTDNNIVMADLKILNVILG